MRSIFTWIVIILIVLAGGWWYFSHPVAPASQSAAVSGAEQQTNDTASTADTGAQAADVPTAATVTLTADGFSPATATIAKGGTVTFVDQSGSPMWIASAAHPSHVVYDGTDRQTHCAADYSGPAPFDECSASTDDYSFTFNSAGTWKYHDHVDAKFFGTIIVQ